MPILETHYPAPSSSPLPLLLRTITLGFPCSKLNSFDPPMHPSVFVNRQKKAERDPGDPCSVHCSRWRKLLLDVRHCDDLGVDWLNAADGCLVALKTLRKPCPSSPYSPGSNHPPQRVGFAGGNTQSSPQYQLRALQGFDILRSSTDSLTDPSWTELEVACAIWHDLDQYDRRVRRSLTRHIHYTPAGAAMCLKMSFAVERTRSIPPFYLSSTRSTTDPAHRYIPMVALRLLPEELTRTRDPNNELEHSPQVWPAVRTLRQMNRPGAARRNLDDDHTLLPRFEKSIKSPKMRPSILVSSH
ncbi:hypothetical protein DFH08DRAFT_272901 [Mycena albidolilacea]|uniref:Uncharacterized protein n=1 Tax=Mycena albidolilacea TaxID=1033008 RepID=A0AAD7APA3_9AGAR|nr:hypothetical protein DFH08DRAFT_272901 [Mycena albidolilacea]